LCQVLPAVDVAAFVISLSNPRFAAKAIFCNTGFTVATSAR
jgi:hypothetical protein